MPAPTPEVLRLREELRLARTTIARLTETVTDLRRCNEAQYRANYDRNGGPALDARQPFGSIIHRSHRFASDSLEQDPQT